MADINIDDRMRYRIGHKSRTKNCDYKTKNEVEMVIIGDLIIKVSHLYTEFVTYMASFAQLKWSWIWKENGTLRNDNGHEISI